MNYNIPKYCDAFSILLVNEAGALRKLHCPFRVRYIGEPDTFKSGMHLWVEEVGTTPQDELTYWILGKAYSHSLFTVKASF